MGTEIFSTPGGAATSTGGNGGKVYGYNNITNASNTVVAQANVNRRSITFHNPGSNDIFVSQTTVQNALGTAPTSPADVAFVPTTSLLGGVLRVFANGGSLTITGECQRAWQALASSGTTNPLTVIDSNV